MAIGKIVKAGFYERATTGRMYPLRRTARVKAASFEAGTTIRFSPA